MSEDPDATRLLVEALGVSEAVAIQLVRAGITSVEELAYVPVAELLETPGIEQNVLVEARKKARARLAI